jgi:hypothetical protein
MSNNQIPCKDCITLPICRSYVLKKSNLRYTRYLRVLLLARDKCSLLDNYLSSLAVSSQQYKYRRWCKIESTLRYMETADENTM